VCRRRTRSSAGYAGAAVAKAGWAAILVSGWTKTLAFIVLAP